MNLHLPWALVLPLSPFSLSHTHGDENRARSIKANPVTLSGKWISEAGQGWGGELCLISSDRAHIREPFWKA